MKKMFAFALVALLAVPTLAFGQTLNVTANPLGGTPATVVDIAQGSQFNVTVHLNTGGLGASASEFVMTELALTPEVFKFGTVKVNNTTLDLGDNNLGEYVLAHGACVDGDVPIDLVVLTYGAFGGAIPPDTIIEVRGFQPGDTQPSTFDGAPGFVDCTPPPNGVGYPAAMGGTDGGTTGSGAVFPDGSCLINGTPVVVDNEAGSFGQLKGRF